MEPPQTKSKTPSWVWILAGLALLMLCGLAVTGVVAIGAFSLFTTTAPESSARVVLGDPIEDPAAVQELEPSPTRFPATSSPAAELNDLDPTSVPTESAIIVEEQNSDESQAGETDGDEGLEQIKPQEDDWAAAERAVIEANVVDIRQLEPLAPVNPTLLSTSGLGQRLEEEFAESYGPTEARNEAIALSAFDFIQADFDIYDFMLRLYTEQIAGFYDPESDEFVIVGDDDEFDVLEQWTHAHEYVHALQDQYYNLESLEDDSLDSGATFAIRALAEGDATLVQTHYLMGGYFSQDQLLEILTSALEIDTAVLDSAPPILARELEFPYLNGMEFVQALYDQGGYAAIDAAWDQPPQSAEHILHPDRYLSGDAPQLVSIAPLTDTLGAGWQLAEEDIFGEFFLREYLSQQLDSDDVNIAATGWGGDSYAVYWNESTQQIVMVLKIAWDSTTDGQEFHAAYPEYPNNLLGVSGLDQPDAGICWQGTDVICLSAIGEKSLLVRAPDMATMRNVISVQTP